VTLEQVAPDVRSKICYTYDFGDDWEHDISVEKVLDRDATASYPRCTGGRRPPHPKTAAASGVTPISWRPWPTPPTPNTKTDWSGSDSMTPHSSTPPVSTPRQ
jgi:pRiA4b ORF-3-like protein